MEEWGFQGRCYNLQQQQLLRHWVRNRASPWAQGMSKRPAPPLDSHCPPRLWPTVYDHVSLGHTPFTLISMNYRFSILTNILQAPLTVLSFSADFINGIRWVAILFWVYMLPVSVYLFYTMCNKYVNQTFHCFTFTWLEPVTCLCHIPIFYILIVSATIFSWLFKLKSTAFFFLYWKQSRE